MKYSILVNTCDKFSDCWTPFFTLWALYWDNCSARIYLNTEYKEFKYPGLDITSVKGCVGFSKSQDISISWSLCLRRALEKIDTDIILYMQEDYFFTDKVHNEWIEYFVDLMLQHNHIQCIHLTDQSVISCGKSPYEKLNMVKNKQRYRACCQAALWRKRELLTLLRDDETAWDFEEYGSIRSAILAHDYCVVDTAWVRKGIYEIIPYIFTGIVQGRWNDAVIELFKSHGIDINYSQRGLLSQLPKKSLLQRVKFRINKWHKNLVKKMELYHWQKSVSL